MHQPMISSVCPHHVDQPELRPAAACLACARRRAARGMTLIEIMVVLAIISLILGGVGVMAFNRLKDARLKDARVNAVQVQQLAEQFHMEKNRCPKNVAELKASGFAARAAKDPWGNDYEIRCEGATMEAVSAGPDGQMGTEDDIGSGDEADKHSDEDANK